MILIENDKFQRQLNERFTYIYMADEKDVFLQKFTYVISQLKIIYFHRNSRKSQQIVKMLHSERQIIKMSEMFRIIYLIRYFEKLSLIHISYTFHFYSILKSKNSKFFQNQVPLKNVYIEKKITSTN